MTVTVSTFVSKGYMVIMHDCQNMKRLHNFALSKAVPLSKKDNITFQERDKISASIVTNVIANDSNFIYFCEQNIHAKNASLPEYETFSQFFTILHCLKQFCAIFYSAAKQSK